MSRSERRHIQRTVMERLAYIHIEPSNGGIVLNVSGEGLCFHSIAPVDRDGPLRFSLLEQNRRIDARGELVWTDEIQKVAGVRFVTLTAEAREQIQNWISQPVVPLEEHKASTSGFAFLRAFPSLDTLRFDRKIDSGEISTFAAAFLKVRARMKLRGFSGGLATGFLLTVLGASMFFLFYTHRHQFGESLIHLGERLAAKSAAERQTPLPAPQVASPTKETVSPMHAQLPPRTRLPVRAQIPADRPKNLVAPSLASRAKPEQMTLRPQISAITVSRAAADLFPHHPSARGTVEVPPPISPGALLGVPSWPATTLIPNKAASPASVELAGPVQVRNSSDESAVSPSMYFDLGRFKDELWAHNLSDKLAKIGLQASVIQRGHLWMNSYQVLVGPYSNEDEAKRIHKDLVTQGYKARPFERGSRNFIFGSGVTLNGTRLPFGDFTISWESYVTNAKVKFEQGNYVLTMADGQWIKHPWRYQHNEFVYQKRSNGSRILLEIHFSGLDRALVFGNSP